MKIQREVLIDELDKFARDGNGLITGAPGVGKSYSILELRDRWQRGNVPHLLIPVEQLGSWTDAEIESVLNIRTDLLSLVTTSFQEVGGSARGIVVFDGFDSARSESTRERVLQIIRRLIAESAGRWTVLVTVRLYDASRSEALRALFRDRAVPSPRAGRGLDETRRFEIPVLNAGEIALAIAQIPGLGELVDASSSDFRELLRIPFNLWLLSQILAVPGSHQPISQISSEVQLLALYWKRRVLASDNLDATRHLLERAVGSMVAANSLSVRRDQVFEASLEAAWAETFSSGVLVPVGATQQRFAFAHNILFDYAVSVLLLDDEPRAMHDFIAADPARPFFLRPSITFYFTRLWYESRSSLWAATWATLTSPSANVRLVGRVVPPAVIVNETRVTNDVSPLLEGIDRRDANASELLLRVFQALRAHKYGSGLVWATLALEAVERPNRHYLWNAVTLAADLLDSRDRSDFEKTRAVVGSLGRRALAWALDERKEREDRFADALGGIWAIVLTARTFDTDTRGSAALIRRVLSLLDQPRFPIEYISRLSDEVNEIAPFDAELVAEIYLAVFAHAEESEEATSFGTPIIPLRSTRRQDFEMCEYSLVKEFDGFLAIAPAHAVRVALQCVNAYAVSQHVVPYLHEGKSVSDLTYRFSFKGHDATVVKDFSSVGGGIGHQEDAMQLLHKVIARLQNAVVNKEEQIVSTILDEFALHAEVAVSWRALLNLGTRYPETLGRELASLAAAPALQRAIEFDLSAFVRQASHYWSSTDLLRLEESITAALEEAAPSSKRPSGRRVAELLLLALPLDRISALSLRAQRADLEARPNPPKSNPPAQIEASWQKYDTEEWLTEQGIDTNEPSNRSLLEVEKQLDEIDMQFRNQRPSVLEAKRIAALLERAREQLARDEQTASGQVVELALTKIAAAAQAIARAEGSLDNSLLDLARRVLLDAASSQPAEISEEAEEEFKFPGWSPSPQTEAAQGLSWLVIHGLNGEILEAIRLLITRSEPSVRYLAALELFRIRWQATDRFWSIAAEVAEKEKNQVVLSGLFRALSRLPRDEGPRIARILNTLEQRGIIPADERSDFAEGYTHLVTWLALNVQEPWSIERFEAISRDPLRFGKLTQRMAFQALTVITADYIDDAEVRPISMRAIAWVRRLLASVTAALPALKEPAAESWQGEVLFGVVDDVAARLYFQARPQSKLEGPADPRTLGAYYEAIRPLLGDMIDFGRSADSTLLARTAHHLMQLLHLCLPIDPQGVLHMAADVAQTSERGGYNLDSMAVSEVIAIADALVADHRNELQSGGSLNDFVRLLDVFANAGWPDALRLIWRLDGIFR